MSKRLHWLFIGALAVATSFGTVGFAVAQDYDAGKNGPQLFASDCNACHKGPAGLAKGRDRSALTSFLKEHYTSKQESAELLAAYLLGAGPGDARQDKADTGPGGPKAKRKADREGEPKPDPKADQKPGPKPRAEPAAARSDDQGETHEETAKRTRPDDREAPKGPAETLLSKLHYYGSARGEPKDTARSANPQARLESYATSGSPADSGAHDTAAPASKRKTSDKKKKRDTDATATERPPRTVPPRQTGNN